MGRAANPASLLAADLLTYVLHDSVTGKVKIGRTRHLWKRHRALESGFPCKLTLLAALPHSKAPEKALHRRFRKFRVCCEWFNFAAPIKRFVAKHAKSVRNFPPRPAKGPKNNAAVSVVMPTELLKRIEARAATVNMSRTAYVRRFLLKRFAKKMKSRS